MSDPLAYLITFRTYGTWLHGDARGSVDRHHNVYGTPMLDSKPALQAAERSQLRQSPILLTGAQCIMVAEAVRGVCRDRDWSLLALKVRSNHVHAVVAAPDLPEKVLHALKSRATRQLRAVGMVTSAARLWSRHGSTKYLWKPHHVEQACRYVAEGQGDRLGGEM